MKNWKDELQKISDCPQRQDGMIDQLKDLVVIANKFGFYDAADYLKTIVNKNESSNPPKENTEDFIAKISNEEKIEDFVIQAIEDTIGIRPKLGSIIKLVNFDGYSDLFSPEIELDPLDFVEVIMEVEKEMEVRIKDPKNNKEFDKITVQQFSDKLRELIVK